MRNTRGLTEGVQQLQRPFDWRRVLASVALAAASAVATLSGCSGGASSGTEVSGTSGSAAGATLELQIDGIGTRAQTAKAVWLESGAAGSGTSPAAAGRGTQATKNTSVLSAITGGMDIKSLSTSTTDRDGFRYISASFQVRNAVACGTPGSCTAHAVLRRNVTFMGGIPVAQLPPSPTASLNPSPFVSVTRYDGSAADPALVPQIKPAHGVDGLGDIQPGLASLQVFNETEVPVPTGTVVGALVPYGFVVRNVNDNSRSLSASPAVNQFDGLVTFAFRFPIQPNAADNPFKISILVQAKEDSNTRTTQSLQEQTFAGDNNATLRELSLGSNDLAVLGGRVSQTIIGNPICQVRTTGTAASPTSYMVNQIPSPPSVQAAPINLEAVFPFSDIVLGFCETVGTPTQNTLWVHGSMSGLRRVGGLYAGTPNGGNTTGQKNQLIWNVFAFRPFFANETVQFTATSGNVNSLGTPIAPFVGSYRVRGNSVPSSGTQTLTNTRIAGIGPVSAAVGDVNGNGTLVLVVANTTGSNVSVTGLIPGNFSLTGGGDAVYPVSGNPVALKLADVNGDGKLDIITANAAQSTVSVLLASAGGFLAATTYPVGSVPRSVAVGDLNGDGRLDIVTGNLASGDFSVLIGSGSGTFGAASSVPGLPSVDKVALGDLNGDGRLDLVASIGSSVVTLLGSGNGSFGAPTSYPVGHSVADIALGDVNGDGRLDLVTANNVSNNVSVLPGIGSGGFGSAVDYAVGGQASSVSLGDLNGDGRLDVVTTNPSTLNISVLLGTSGGNLGIAANFLAGGHSPFFATLFDRNGDGKLDVLFTDIVNNAFGIFAGQ